METRANVVRKAIAAVCVLLVFLVSPASGGIVTFDAGGPAEVEQGGTLDMLVTISAADFATFNSAGLVIASLELDLLDFAYHSDFLDHLPIPSIPSPCYPHCYPEGSALFVGGINFLADTMTAPLNVGTVTVGADVDLALGSYEVFVSSARDGGMSALTSFSTGIPEPLEGSIMVQVIPEPATLALLGLGAVCAPLLRSNRRGRAGAVRTIDPPPAPPCQGGASKRARNTYAAKDGAPAR